MALGLTLELDSGVTVNSAYHKIVQMTVRAVGTACSAYLEVNTYVDQTKANNAAPPVLVRTYLMPEFDETDDSQTAAAQAYVYLKTLPDFSGAADV
jgi:hypothetical protein